jgi:AhpD family alkylhydroperoxidase
VEAFWMLHGQELRTKGITKGELAEAMKEAANT